jgi:hypothetical protein
MMLKLLEGLVYVSFIAMLWAQALGAIVQRWPCIAMGILFFGCIIADSNAAIERAKIAKANAEQDRLRFEETLADLAELRELRMRLITPTEMKERAP